MFRTSIVAGQFYSADASSLKEEIKQFTSGGNVRKHDALGFLLPHAGYMFSGRVAAETIASVNLADNFIIIGPNHTGMGETFSLNLDQTWHTPLGQVKVNQGLAAALLEATAHLRKDFTAHLTEHSIEVQLPFLQYHKKDFTIVPIVVSSAKLEVYKEIGKTIARVIKRMGIEKTTQIIASSDMTHYEPADAAKEKDAKAIDAILALDPDLLFNTVRDNDISMCGCIPAIIMLEAMRGLGAKSAKLIKYENSGETSGDYNSVVGYAGMIIS